MSNQSLGNKVALVTGAAGFVGSHLVAELKAEGYTVRAMVRDRGRLGMLDPAGIDLVVADITDRDALSRAFEGADLVFHIAALYREVRFPDSEYFRVNTEGTRNVFDIAQACSVKQVLHCSTIGVHSHIAHPPADESEPYAPTDVYQISKMEGEKIAFERLRSGAIGGAVIRPAMIWGPGDTRFLKLFRGIARRRLPLIGSGRVWTHWIYVKDLARAFRLAAEIPAANGELFIIAGNQPVLLCDVFTEIARCYGVRLLPVRIPVLPLQIAGRIVELICKPFGVEPPLHRRRADFFIKSRAFDCQKAARVLGFKAASSFLEELRSIAEWYRKAGWL